MKSGAMLLRINPDNPQERKIDQVVECLKQGGVIIYPTDTIYGLGCDIFNQKAVEKVCQIKGIKSGAAKLSFVCHDLSHLADFAASYDKSVYKVMRKNLPGPFTFILNASREVPKLFKSNKKTVGIRVPDHNVARQLVSTLGRPILSTSLNGSEEDEGLRNDPELIYEKYYKQVDIVIDSGFVHDEPSTVVDVTSGQVEILREGRGELIY